MITFRVILNNVRKLIILIRFFIFDLDENMLNDIIADFFWLALVKKVLNLIFGCSIYWKIIFLELCRRFCIRWTGPIFGVKLNLHIYKTVKDFEIRFLPDIPFAN